MRSLRSSPALAATLFALLLALPACAASNRIFISTNGNNASDCANPLTPCLTFAGALAQVNPGGEVIAEATGGYGALNVTQAVTISGPPGIVMYSGLPVTVNAPSATVVLRGLTIDGGGAVANGIFVSAVGTLHVEKCVITGFANGAVNNGNGILFAAPGGQLFVEDTTIRGNANAGVWVFPQFLPPGTGSAQATIDHCRLDGNSAGLVSSGGGVSTVRNTVASGSLSAGFSAGFGAELNIEDSLASNNGGSGIDCNGGLARVSNATVTDNGTGLSFSNAGVLLSRGNNTVEGNGTDGTFSGTYSAK
jgi:hypothetical protein